MPRPHPFTVIALLWARSEVRYLVVAGTIQLFYFLLFTAQLALGWHYFAAMLAAQAVTIAAAFPLYRRVIFRSTGPRWGDFRRFLGVWAGGAGAGIITMPILVEWVGIPPWPAQAIAILAVSVASYLGHRFISFRPRPSPGRPPG